MAARFKTWSREEVLALPEDGNRYELVDGALLVSPSPRWAHQSAVGALYRRLDRYVRPRRLGHAMFSPADLDLDSGQLIQPDVFVVGPGRGREWASVGIPRLVAEVLSPSTAEDDRVTKRRRYQRSGVPTYWIVDVDARIVEVWTPPDTTPAIVTDQLTWHPDQGVLSLRIDLPAFFREVWADGGP